MRGRADEFAQPLELNRLIADTKIYKGIELDVVREQLLVSGRDRVS